MKRVASYILIVILISSQAWADENPCDLTSEAVRQASLIRGLSIKRKTPCLLQDKEEVKKYLLKTINEKIPRQRMESEGLIYKALGFIPADFDYEQGLVKLYLDQLGGYYDPNTDRFVMAVWMPAMMQVTVAVHELTHALQDQYFDLVSFTDEKKFSSDELLARSALIEGDATAVMLDYTHKLVGQGPISKEPNVNSIMMQNLLGAGMMASIKDVPESLKVTLLFPYTSGLRFAHEILKNGGYKKIDIAFKNPPRSTEEILHLEKYKQAEPDFIKVEALKLNVDDKILHEDTMGEFAITALLAGFERDKKHVADVAQGWGGDRVAVLEDGNHKKIVTWKIHWDTSKDAAQFCEAYEKVLAVIKGFGQSKLSCKSQDATIVWTEK